MEGTEWDGRMGGRTGRQADERTGTSTLGGRADGGGQWADGWTGGRTVEDEFLKGKTPKLTHQLT